MGVRERENKCEWERVSESVIDGETKRVKDGGRGCEKESWFCGWGNISSESNILSPRKLVLN